MDKIVTQLAASEAGGGLFEALGIDWQLLVIQTLAFLVLLWFLGKVVYPPLTRMLEKRDADIEAGAAAAAAAEKKADEASAKVDELLKQARKEANEIVLTAKDEATTALEAADAKAKARAEQIIADAKEQIDKDVIAARKVLHNETITLVAQATEKVVGKTMTGTLDDSVVAAAVKEAK